MDDLILWLSGNEEFPARWFCGRWSSVHGWIHIISDLAVWSAYMAIPIVLAYFILKRKNMPFPKVFWLFCAFIAACGTVHLIEALIFWTPIYRISAFFKVLTAIVSWATVISLIPIVPKALKLRSPKELENEIQKRKEVELELENQHKLLLEKNKELSIAKSGLEDEVNARTNELIHIKEKLEVEVLKQTKKLKARVKELESTNALMVDRELKMAELKNEIKRLKGEI